MLSQALSDAVSKLAMSKLNRADGRPVEWAVSQGYIGYEAAVAAMEARVAAIATGEAGEMVWLLEHPPLYTAGVSSKDEDLLDAARFPVHRSGRGGQFTYHGPGQRVAYVMLDLNARGKDVRTFVRGLEQWIIAAVGEFGVTAGVRAGRVGVWVVPDSRFAASGMTSRFAGAGMTSGFAGAGMTGGGGGEAKIAAIGVKVRKWVSFHGISLNVEPDLDHFTGIVPCGISDHGVTSLVDLGVAATMDQADAALRTGFRRVFGAVEAGRAPV